MGIGAALLFCLLVSGEGGPRGHPICPVGLWGEGPFVEATLVGARRMAVAAVSGVPCCHRPEPRKRWDGVWMVSLGGIPAPLAST